MCMGMGAAHAKGLDEWMDLCYTLGVSLNLAKHQRCTQSVEYPCHVQQSHARAPSQLGKQKSLLGLAADIGQPASFW